MAMEYMTPWFVFDTGKIVVDCATRERASHRTSMRFYKADLGQSDGGIDWYCATCLAHLVRMPPHPR